MPFYLPFFVFLFFNLMCLRPSVGRLTFCFSFLCTYIPLLGNSSHALRSLKEVSDITILQLMHQ